MMEHINGEFVSGIINIEFQLSWSFVLLSLQTVAAIWRYGCSPLWVYRLQPHLIGTAFSSAYLMVFRMIHHNIFSSDKKDIDYKRHRLDRISLEPMCDWSQLEPRMDPGGIELPRIRINTFKLPVGLTLLVVFLSGLCVRGH